ncbi:hypothetical protein [Halioxenophilus aromaticivorans]|uniref:DUF1059 domain-containing protein n=1 Tax=Halioxenophilus aromaticivorans TaxID=1306992 RepID=A0AAV3U983_9ALTE
MKNLIKCSNNSFQLPEGCSIAIISESGDIVAQGEETEKMIFDSVVEETISILKKGVKKHSFQKARR